MLKRYISDYKEIIISLIIIFIMILGVLVRHAYYDWKCDVHEVKASQVIPEDSNDVLAGKTLVFIGDSICFGVGADGEAYPTWVKNYHPKAHIYNLGLGGMPIANVNDNEYTLVARIDKGEFDRFKGKADFVFLQGGINDVIMEIALGKPVENGEYIDTYTFCGGLEYALKYFTENFDKARIYYMSTYPCKAQNMESQEAEWQMAERICEEWGVTYIDLYGKIPVEELEGEYETWLHAPMMVHRDKIFPVIEAFLEED